MYITGVQGRYFIPLLPLLLLTIYDRRLVIGVDLRKSAWYLECFVSIYALIVSAPRRVCATDRKEGSFNGRNDGRSKNR